MQYLETYRDIISSDQLDIKCPALLVSELDPVLGDNLSIVNSSSTIKKRKAVFRIAQYFRREFDLGYLQYGWDGNETDPLHEAFLWTNSYPVYKNGKKIVHVIGACCFRYRSDHYGMQWVWLHPYARRRGILSKAWPKFIARFGSFDIEPPLSKAMQQFSFTRL